MRGQMTKILEAALIYREKGFSVIPICPPKANDKGEDENKKPYIKWEPYQKKRATEKEIRHWFSKWPNARIAIVTGAISGIDVIDVDSMDGEDKLIETLGEELASFNPPIARTPGNGKHLYVKATGHGNAVGFLPKVDYRGQGGYIITPPSQGLNGKGYAWLQKASLLEIPPPPAPQPIINIINSFNRNGATQEPKERSYTKLHEATRRYKKIPKGLRDDTLFHLANGIIKGNLPVEEIEQLLHLIGLHCCDPPFPLKEIPVKIQSVLNRSQNRKNSVAKEAREWAKLQGGYWETTRGHTELQLATKEDKRAANAEWQRMVREGLLERYGEKRGCYRLVETDFAILEMDDVPDAEPMEIKLPFGMEEHVEIMPKDLVVYAGVPNSGKTALMLETVRLNMHSHRCWYFSTEMSRYNAKKRIAKHRECNEWNFKFSDDFPNYYDVLRPNDLNFIDYVEPPEGEYFKIASYLAGIQKRLKNGLAFVALQKNPGKDYAMGGTGTTAKPALFCSIDPDFPGAILKMVKAKNYRKQNVNGYVHRFKIVDGINIIKDGTWLPET
jgi:hypothetical protein